VEEFEDAKSEYRRTDNTMPKRKSTKGQTMDFEGPRLQPAKPIGKSETDNSHRTSKDFSLL
jgi:hypothetical protein